MKARMKREIAMLERDPPHGVCAWPLDDQVDVFEAQIRGPEDSPYSQGVFKLRLEIPNRYPFEPPKVKFITPVYHPNIDDGGRICLDTLKMPPKGSWSPSINLCTLLATIRLLMSSPNPQDGLMVDITNEYINDRSKFEKKARACTSEHATDHQNRTLSKPPVHELKSNDGGVATKSATNTNSKENKDPGSILEEAATHSDSGRTDTGKEDREGAAGITQERVTLNLSKRKRSAAEERCESEQDAGNKKPKAEVSAS